jgi:hypothetical protein
MYGILFRYADGQIGDALRHDIGYKLVNMGPRYDISAKGAFYDWLKIDKHPRLGYFLEGVGAGLKFGMTALLFSKYLSGGGAAGTAAAGTIASGSSGAGTGAGASSTLSNAGKYFQGIGRSFSNIPLLMVIPTPVLMYEMNQLGGGEKPQS